MGKKRGGGGSSSSGKANALPDEEFDDILKWHKEECGKVKGCAAGASASASASDASVPAAMPAPKLPSLLAKNPAALAMSQFLAPKLVDKKVALRQKLKVMQTKRAGKHALKSMLKNAQEKDPC